MAGAALRAIDAVAANAEIIQRSSRAPGRVPPPPAVSNCIEFWKHLFLFIAFPDGERPSRRLEMLS